MSPYFSDYGYDYLGYDDYRGSYADDYYGYDYGYYEDDYGYGGGYSSPAPRGRGSRGGPPPPPPVGDSHFQLFGYQKQVTWVCNLHLLGWVTFYILGWVVAYVSCVFISPSSLFDLLCWDWAGDWFDPVLAYELQLFMGCSLYYKETLNLCDLQFHSNWNTGIHVIPCTCVYMQKNN